MTSSTTRTVDSGPAVKVHDVRGFWRLLLAAVVPIPWLAKGIQYIIYARDYEHATDQITHDLTHHTYNYLQWLDALFVVLVVPSIVAMVMVARRGAPRLATAAALLMAGGFLLVLPLNNAGASDWSAWSAAQEGLDPKSTGAILDTLVDPRQPLGILGFLVAIVFGSIVIGLALWKSRAVPLWAALAVALGGATHIFLGFNHIVHGLGLVVLATGCVRVSLTLRRMSNDDFDLPPHG